VHGGRYAGGMHRAYSPVVAKKWRVYPFAQHDVESARKQNLLQVVDPTNVAESVTVRVGDRDGVRIYQRLSSQDSPASFEVQFEEPIVILDRAPLPQEIRDKVRATKLDRSPLILAARTASSPVKFDADLGQAFTFTSDELSNNRSGFVPFSQRIRLFSYWCLQLLAVLPISGFALAIFYFIGANPAGSLRGRLIVFLLAGLVALVGLVQAIRVLPVLVDVFWPSPAIRTGTLILRTSESLGQILFGKRIWKRMVSKYYFADAEDWSLSRFYLLGIIQILLEGLGFFHDTEFKVSQRFAQTVPGVLQCTVYYSRWGQRLLSVDRLE
jgi:hypothetical protein